MSETLRKRGREAEALADTIDAREPKRFHGQETDEFLYLLQLDKTLVDDEEDEEYAPSEELVKGVMRSLEEEIVATCSTSNLSSDSGDFSSASDISRSYEGQNLDSNAELDLTYLLEASDNELGIPPSPVLDFKDEVCVSTKETSELSYENRDLKSLGENWHFEDVFENRPQLIELYEDAWDATQLQDYMNADFASQDMFFDCDFSSPWTLETAVKGLCNTV